MRAVTSLLLALLFPCVASALALTAPPYIQKTTTSGACIRWSTDIGSDSSLEYGSSPTSLTLSSTTSGSRTDHQECPTGLAANTVYYYRVGSTTTALAGGDSDHYFRTHPTPGTEAAVRIWFVSDMHYVRYGWEAVRDSYLRFTAGKRANVVLTGGDNFGESTTVAHILATMTSLAAITRHTSFWPTMGNHDVSGEANYFSMMTLPTAGESGGYPSGTEAYYSFDYGNVHFMALNGYQSSYPITAPDSPQYTWIQADLAANTQPWIIAYSHYPPYSKGQFDSDTQTDSTNFRSVALPLLEAAGLDLHLAGHEHSNERSRFISGHYGLSGTYVAATHLIQDGRGGCCGRYYSKASDGPGTVYVDLASYAINESGGSFDHPANLPLPETRCGAADLNVPSCQSSLVIDIQGDLLDAHWIRQDGWQMDAFQIQHTD